MTLKLILSTVALSIISFLLMIRDIGDHRELYNGGSSESEKPSSLYNSAIVYSVILFAITVGAAVMFCTIYKNNDVLHSIKRLALLSVLWPIAYIDYKTYRIPNSFIVFGLICRAVILIFELFDPNGIVRMTLLSEVIAAASLLVAAVLCSLCMKNSIGFGDMKLFVIMGLLLSLDGIWGAIFLSLIVSFFISAYLLLSKKKTRKDAIPFGPAIVIGAFLSVCLTGT